MPATGRWALALVLVEALRAGSLGLALIAVLAVRADSPTRFGPIETGWALPVASVLLAAAGMGVCAGVGMVRRRSAARRTALALLFATSMVEAALLASAATGIGPAAGYRPGLAGLALAAASIAAIVLCSHRTTEAWCDR